jgi:DNA-binding beta-propeller fold protein YncE
MLHAALLLLLLQSNPPAAPAASSGRLVVLNKAEASASLLDLTTGAERARLPVGVGPHEVAVSPDGKTAVVANYGGAVPGSSLTLIDLVAEKPTRTLDLGQAARPHGIVYDPDGVHVWVTAEQRKSLLQVRVADGVVVQEISTPNPVGHMVVQNASGGLYVSHIGGGGVTYVKSGGEAQMATAFFPTGQGAEGIALTPDGRRVWVGHREDHNVVVLETSDMKTLATMPAAGFPIRVQITPDGRTALVSCAEAGVLRFYDTDKLVETGSLDFSAQVKADLSTGHLLDDFGASPVPVGIVIAPDGGRAYVALTNAHRIAEVDLKTRTVARWLTAGKEPDGMAWYPH